MENSTTTNQITFIQILSDTFVRIGDFIYFVFSKKETWFVLIGVIIFILAYKGWGRYKKNREGLLTYKLKQELNKSCKQEKRSSVKLYLEQLYLPSWQSVLFVLIIGTILFFLAHITKLGIIFNSLKYIDGNHYQNLIAIHAGIGAIIFALLIFIYE